MKESLFEACNGLQWPPCQHWSYSTSVHYHFKVALFVKIKQKQGPLRDAEQTSDSASKINLQKGLIILKRPYASLYKGWVVDVFDLVRWLEWSYVCPFLGDRSCNKSPSWAPAHQWWFCVLVTGKRIRWCPFRMQNLTSFGGGGAFWRIDVNRDE